ncbi:COG1470 family protein [Cetobacterium sp.]|uniref:COG1470 family protein n=2 Tax=Cetobacterium sp. TaxID=2071632 RepID=UPI003F3F3688
MIRKHSFKLALLLSLATSSMAFGAITPETPLANTDIGNQAYVSYFTEANQQKFLQSNIVITRVNSIYNFSLTPDRTTIITKGGTALFSHTLTNIGNSVDSYDLSHDYGLRPNVRIIVDRNNNGIVDAGETAITPDENGKHLVSNINPGERINILVSVPTSVGEAGSEINSKLHAESKGKTDLPKLSVDEQILFQTGGNAIVYKALNKASGSSENDTEITVYLKIANDDPTASNIAKDFSLTDTLDTKFKYVAGSAKWKNYNGIDTVLSDADDNESDSHNNQPLKFKAEKEGEKDKLTFELPNGVPGDSPLSSSNGYLEFRVVVPANTPIGTIPNEVNYKFTPTGETTSIPRISNRVNYEVLKYVRATFTGHHIPEGQAGETLRFVNKFVNTANASERFALTLADQFFPAGTTFRMTIESKEGNNTVERPVMDTNGDGDIDTGLVAPGEPNSINVILYATLPINMANPGSDFKIVKVAKSIYNPNYSVRANDTVGTVKVSTVDITNNYSIAENPDNAPGLGLGPERNPVTQNNANPGEISNFVLHINNTSQYIEEQYNLEVSTRPDFSDMTLPAGIVVKFKQGGGAEVTKTAKIAPNSSQRIDAEVTISPTATATVIPLYFRATSAVTGARDIKYDSLSINPIRSVQIIPNLKGETYAGGNIVYTHKVRNNGNVIEGNGIASSVTLSTTESLAQWRTELFLDVNKNGIFEIGIDQPFVDFATIGGLKAGEEVTVFARVFVPLGAPTGVKNITTITPNVTQGTYSTAPTVTSAVDETTVLAEKLSITKYQRLNTSDPWKTGIQNANPEDKIYYKITVRNTGTDDARVIQLKDTVPFYTRIIYGVDSIPLPRYEVKNADGTIISSGDITSKPANGEMGELSVNVDVLPPGYTIDMYFVVKINGITHTN